MVEMKFSMSRSFAALMTLCQTHCIVRIIFWQLRYMKTGTNTSATQYIHMGTKKLVDSIWCMVVITKSQIGHRIMLKYELIFGWWKYFFSFLFPLRHAFNSAYYAVKSDGKPKCSTKTWTNGQTCFTSANSHVLWKRHKYIYQCAYVL